MSDFWVGLFVGLIIASAGCGVYQKRTRMSNGANTMTGPPAQLPTHLQQPRPSNEHYVGMSEGKVSPGSKSNGSSHNSRSNINGSRGQQHGRHSSHTRQGSRQSQRTSQTHVRRVRTNSPSTDNNTTVDVVNHHTRKSSMHNNNNNNNQFPTIDGRPTSILGVSDAVIPIVPDNNRTNHNNRGRHTHQRTHTYDPGAGVYGHGAGHRKGSNHSRKNNHNNNNYRDKNRRNMRKHDNNDNNNKENNNNHSRNLDGIAAAASNSIALRKEQELLQLEKQMLLREKKEFEIHKKQTIEEYKLRKYEIDEEMKSYSNKKKLYDNAFKKLKHNDPQYASLIAQQLEFEMKKLKLTSKDNYDRLKEIETRYQDTYKLLDTIRNEITKLITLKKEFSDKILSMKKLIGTKSEQHAYFIQTMKTLKHETFYLPWLITGNENNNNNNNHSDNNKDNKTYKELSEQVRKEILKEWDALEQEKQNWSKMRRNIEIKNALVTHIDFEKEKLLKMKNEMKEISNDMQTLKQTLLNDIVAQDANNPFGQSNIDAKKMELKWKEIEIECKQELLNDELRNIEYEKNLLLIQDKHLNDEKLLYEKKNSILDAQIKVVENKEKQLSNYNDNINNNENNELGSGSGKSPKGGSFKSSVTPFGYNESKTPGNMVSRIEYQKMEKESQKQLKTIAHLKSLLGDKDKRMESLTYQLNDKLNEYNSKQTELENANKKIMQLQISIAEYQKEKRENENEDNDAIRDIMEQFQNEIKTYHEKTIDLEMKLNRFKSESEKWHEMEQEYKEMKKMRQSLENDIVDYKLQINKLENEISELQNYCNYLEEHNSAIEEQFNDILNANAMAMEQTQEIRVNRKRKTKSLAIPGTSIIDIDTDNDDSKDNDSFDNNGNNNRNNHNNNNRNNNDNSINSNNNNTSNNGKKFDKNEFMRQFEEKYNGNDDNTLEMMQEVTNFAKKVSMDISPNERFLNELGAMSDEEDMNDENNSDVDANLTLNYWLNSNEPNGKGASGVAGFGNGDIDEIEKELKQFEQRWAKLANNGNGDDDNDMNHDMDNNMDNNMDKKARPTSAKSAKSGKSITFKVDSLARQNNNGNRHNNNNNNNNSNNNNNNSNNNGYNELTREYSQYSYASRITNNTYPDGNITDNDYDDTYSNYHD